MIGNKIYELRKKYNMSQEQLAEKLNITRQTVSNWETNQTVPDAYQLKDISTIFEVSTDEILEIKKYEKDIESNNNILYKAKEYLKNKISTVSYETWIEPLELKQIKEDLITITVPMDFIGRFIKDNYYEELLDALNQFTNIELKRIDFVIN